MHNYLSIIASSICCVFWHLNAGRHTNTGGLLESVEKKKAEKVFHFNQLCFNESNPGYYTLFVVGNCFVFS